MRISKIAHRFLRRALQNLETSLLEALELFGYRVPSRPDEGFYGEVQSTWKERYRKLIFKSHTDRSSPDTNEIAARRVNIAKDAIESSLASPATFLSLLGASPSEPPQAEAKRRNTSKLGKEIHRLFQVSLDAPPKDFLAGIWQTLNEVYERPQIFTGLNGEAAFRRLAKVKGVPDPLLPTYQKLAQTVAMKIPKELGYSEELSLAVSWSICALAIENYAPPEKRNRSSILAAARNLVADLRSRLAPFASGWDNLNEETGYLLEALENALGNPNEAREYLSSEFPSHRNSILGRIRSGDLPGGLKEIMDEFTQEAAMQLVSAGMPEDLAQSVVWDLWGSIMANYIRPKKPAPAKKGPVKKGPVKKRVTRKH